MIALALLAVLTQAPQLGPTSGGISRGNFLRIPAYRTPGTGAQSYFVDPAGSDTNTCQASGAASACLTIQGAINKIPKLLRDQVTVNVAAGNYAGFYISGFTSDVGVQQTTGGILIDGALVNSTLASGSATGTAAGAGQSAGSGSTFGTLCDSGATWTVSDLVGRFITTASPTNTTFVVTANTATCVTIAGTWTVPVAGSTTYTIQDPSVIITTSGGLPGSPFVTGTTTGRAGAYCTDNNLVYRTNLIGLRSMRFANTTGTGIEIADISAYRIDTVQIRPSAATASGFFIGMSTNGMQPAVDIRKTDVSLNSSGSVSTGSGIRLSLSNSLFRQAGASTSGFNFASGAPPGLVSLTSSEITGWPNAFVMLNASGVSSDAIPVINGMRVTCTAVGFLLGGSPASTVSGQAVIGTITNTNITTCPTAVQVQGTSIVDITAMTGAAATTGFAVSRGGAIIFTKAGVTLTAGTTEVLVEGGTSAGGISTTFAGILANNCASVIDTGSKVCAR